MTVYVAFPGSTRLVANVGRLNDAIKQQPEVVQQALIHEISLDFISEVLAAFFDGPLRRLNAQGSMASVLNGFVSIIGKASRSLVNRVFDDISAAEQQHLAAQFAAAQVQRDEAVWIGFPLADEVASEAALTFASFHSGTGDEAQLVRVMGHFADGAIEHFFDRTLGAVQTGPVTRRLVSAGRATIHKAAHTSMRKTLPGLHPKLRLPVLDYFADMLVEA